MLWTCPRAAVPLTKEQEVRIQFSLEEDHTQLHDNTDSVKTTLLKNKKGDIILLHHIGHITRPTAVDTLLKCPEPCFTPQCTRKAMSVNIQGCIFAWKIRSAMCHHAAPNIMPALGTVREQASSYQVCSTYPLASLPLWSQCHSGALCWGGPAGVCKENVLWHSMQASLRGKEKSNALWASIPHSSCEWKPKLIKRFPWHMKMKIMF